MIGLGILKEYFNTSLSEDHGKTIIASNFSTKKHHILLKQYEGSPFFWFPERSRRGGITYDTNSIFEVNFWILKKLMFIRLYKQEKNNTSICSSSWLHCTKQLQWLSESIPSFLLLTRDSWILKLKPPRQLPL